MAAIGGTAGAQEPPTARDSFVVLRPGTAVRCLTIQLSLTFRRTIVGYGA